MTVDNCTIIYFLSSAQIRLIRITVSLLQSLAFPEMTMTNKLKTFILMDIVLFILMVYPLTSGMTFKESMHLVAHLIFLVTVYQKNYYEIEHLGMLCSGLDCIYALFMLHLFQNTSWYLYKLILSIYPLILSLYVCERVYGEYTSWMKTIIAFAGWITVLPMVLECGNAAWVTKAYDTFLKNYMYAIDAQFKYELLEWLHENPDELLLRLCCINHIFQIKRGVKPTPKSYLEYLNTMKIDDDHNYYTQITWNDLERYKIRFNFKKMYQEFILHMRFLRPNYAIFPGFRVNYFNFRTNMNYRTLIDLSKVILLGLMRLFFGLYVIATLLNTFVIPLWRLWTFYHELTSLERLLNIFYIRVLIDIVYRLYVIVKGELLLKHIPNMTIGHQRWKRGHVHKYYKWIKFDVGSITKSLIGVLGEDIASIVLSYTPDYVEIYSEK